MKYVVLSIRDRGADVFGTPYCSASVGQAIRAFGDEVNRDAPENLLAKHPDDFDLYQIGLFDDASGRFEMADDVRVLIRGKDVRK